jgi:ATP-dependent DNA helicase RecQ
MVINKNDKNNISGNENMVKADSLINSLPFGCVLLDIERISVEKNKWNITEIALISSAGEEHYQHPTGIIITQILERIEQTQVIIGHNIRYHDIPHLYTRAKRKKPAELNAKICDTLEVSSLFFVGKSQHKLNKLYREELGLSNPIEDAWESYSIYKDICNNLPKLVRYWAWQLLPPGYPRDLIGKIESIEETEWDTLKHTKLNIAALENYLQGLPRKIENLGAVVFLNWLYQLNQPEKRRPVWLENEFSTFREAENQAFSIPVDKDNLEKELKYFFNHNKFRKHQLEIIQALLKGETVPLGILPTGGGKSIIFQLPALIFSRYRRGLSIIVSPLQALMADQVDNLKQTLEKQGLHDYAERVEMIAGNQTLEEQRNVIDGVWNGKIDILYLSPERLRQPTIQRILKHRLPEMWVLDEAHTLSQWGHDFRPDFLRIANGLQEFYKSKNNSINHSIKFGLVTATATQKVEQDLKDTIEKLGALVQGSFERLPIGEESFQRRPEITSYVEIVERPESIDDIPNSKRFQKTKEYLAKGKGSGVAIVYVPTRRMAEKYAQALNNCGFKAKPFHSRIFDKTQVITAFKAGEIDVVVATNAFGMGIDRECIHTVIHVAPPRTPEAYLQEIGRLARKEGEKGSAYLFWHPDDFDWIFEQEVRSQISLKALRDCWDIIRPRLNKGRTQEAWVSALDFATPLNQEDEEILATQTGVAIYYLEQAELIREKESCPCYLNISLNKELTQEEINKLNNSSKTIGIFLFEIGLRHPQKNIQLDVRDVSLSIGISPLEVVKSIRKFVKDGFADWKYEIAFKLNTGKKLNINQFYLSTKYFLDWLAQESPELQEEGYIKIYQDAVDQQLKQLDKKATLTESLQFLKGLKLVNYSKQGRDTIHLFLKQEERRTEWLKTANQKLDRQKQEIDIVAKCLHQLFEQKNWEIKDSQLLDLAELENLLKSNNNEINNIWEVMFLMQRLNLVVMGRGNLGTEMLYRLIPGKRQNWSEGVYTDIEKHYEQKNRRIYAMNLLLKIGIKPEKRIEILKDYFTKSLDEFDQQYFPKLKNIEGGFRNSPIAQKILENLNPTQKQIVTDDHSRALLVLAGPGSGKTHTIVSRVGYLISARGVPPAKILVLAYNRTAAAEVRKRLYQLLGQYGSQVDALTFHALAMKLTGKKRSDAPQDEQGEKLFNWLLNQLIEHLHDPDNHPQYQYILVDEYQDVNDAQYQIIKLLAGFDRQDEDESQKSFLMAVGDDDQNLFEFIGADIQFIRRFCQDYNIANTAIIPLIKNYRSRPTIVEFANRFIEKAISPEKRLKGIEQRIESVNNDKPGKILWGEYHHPYHAASWIADKIAEILTDPNLPKENIAVLAHQWKDLRFLQHILKERWGNDQDIAYQFYSNKDDLRPGNSRIGQAILEELKKVPDLRVSKPKDHLEKLRQELGYSDCDAAWAALLHALPESSEMTQEDIVYLLEEARLLRPGKVILSTFHSAKGSEFSHVFVLENCYTAPRELETHTRKLYVGFTRAKEELYILFPQKIQLRHPELIQVLTNINYPYIQQIVIDRLDLPDSIRYQWFLEPKDLYLSYRDIIAQSGRRFIENYTHEWGQLYLRSSKKIDWKDSRNVNCIVSILSNKGEDELNNLCCQNNSLLGKGYTVFRVERDDDYYRTARYQGTEDHHYIVLPYFEVEEVL